MRPKYRDFYLIASIDADNVANITVFCTSSCLSNRGKFCLFTWKAAIFRYT